MKNIKQVICGIIGHVPYRPKYKREWRRDCKRCGKELVIHEPKKVFHPAELVFDGGNNTAGTTADVGGLITNVSKPPEISGIGDPRD